MFWFFGRKVCGILAPRPGIEPAPPALDGEVLTTGPPGKPLNKLTECLYELGCVVSAGNTQTKKTNIHQKTYFMKEV